MENLDIGVGSSCQNVANELNLDDDDLIYTPQVSDELRPKKGQEFDTIDDVLTFYNAYAKAAGFSVRSWTTQKEAGSCEIRRKEYVCFKQGKSLKIADVGKKRRRGSLAEDCTAKIAVLKSNSGKYIVTVFNEEHSHPLSTPSKVHLLRSHRNVSAATKSLTKQLSMVNIPQHQQFSFLGVQSGGIENIGCTQRDLYNHERDIRADMKGHDGEMFYEYLKLEQGKNPSFTFQIEADEERKITRCFWSDARSRRAYNYFGDVVIFDTTYNTNRYGLIFAPIMGVNNHGQTIIFACGFLNHESVDDFVWLFTQNSFNEPDQVRAKGCGKRLKGGKEKAMARAKNKKDRHCHGCGKIGQSHDKRNCPALTNPFSTSGDTNLQEGNESSSEDVDLFED